MLCTYGHSLICFSGRLAKQSFVNMLRSLYQNRYAQFNIPERPDELSMLEQQVPSFNKLLFLNEMQ